MHTGLIDGLLAIAGHDDVIAAVREVFLIHLETILEVVDQKY
jgi:hypothetical protein